jgi:hypothetical protein
MKFRGSSASAPQELEGGAGGAPGGEAAGGERGERESISARINDVEKELYEEIQDALDEILPEAYATVKEAAGASSARRSRSPARR